jgi:phage terminase Nu1 subunit (DNA packaging protein)
MWLLSTPDGGVPPRAARVVECRGPPAGVPGCRRRAPGGWVGTASLSVTLFRASAALKPLASRGLSVSKKQCCDILGWTSTQFDNAVRAGMPVVERPNGRGTDWIVFMGDVIRWIVEQELKAAGHEPSEMVKLDLNAERARLAKEQADKTQMENELARGELVRASEVAKSDEIIYTALRDRIMGIVSIAPVLKDVALTGGVAGVREQLRVSIADALENVGTKQLPGLQDPKAA